jgi:1,6-anhydro-N-acetylmuramate kinase
VLAWDLGPANALIDAAVGWLTDGAETYDRDGARTERGTVREDLLEVLLDEPYYALPAPAPDLAVTTTDAFGLPSQAKESFALLGFLTWYGLPGIAPRAPPAPGTPRCSARSPPATPRSASPTRPPAPPTPGTASLLAGSGRGMW